MIYMNFAICEIKIFILKGVLGIFDHFCGIHFYNVWIHRLDTSD